VNRVVVRWLEGHGLPGWLAPSYMMTVALAGFLGAMAFFWLVRRDKADRVLEGRALLFGYLAALAGGYVLEGLRAVPEAIARGSISPFFHVGRAAYGGLIAGVLVPVFVLRRYGLPARPFLDRVVPLLGITYASVRTGCFLAGCDYGRVTGGSLGVRFPVGSPAALDHAGLGWVPAGAPSLPVHATQLYEAALGAVASGIAAIWLVRGHRDGRAFCTWLGVYAVGRFLIEFIRGDRSRGIYGGLSSAQFISIAILLGIAAVLLWTRRDHNNNNNRNNRLAPALGAFLGIGLIAGVAEAQPSSPPAPKSTSSAAPAPSQPPPAPSASAPQPAPAASGSAAVPAPPPPAWPTVQPQPARTSAPPPPAPQQPYPYPYPYTQQPYPYPPQPYPYPPQPYPYPPQPYPYPQQPYPYPPQPYPPPAATTPYPPPQPTAPAPQPTAPDATTPPPEEPPEPEPKVTDQKEANQRRMAVTLGLSGYFVPARFTVQNGGALDLDVVARLKMSEKNRFEIGVGLRGGMTADTKLYSVGVPLRFQFGVGRNLEMSLGALPAFYLLSFDSPYFDSAAAFGMRLSWGIQFPIGSQFVFGFSPVSFLVLASPEVDTVFAYDPSFWVGAGFF
jgi:prolipoprotein diacylglyceryltransferase